MFDCDDNVSGLWRHKVAQSKLISAPDRFSLVRTSTQSNEEREREIGQTTEYNLSANWPSSQWPRFDPQGNKYVTGLTSCRIVDKLTSLNTFSDNNKRVMGEGCLTMRVRLSIIPSMQVSSSSRSSLSTSSAGTLSTERRGSWGRTGGMKHLIFPLLNLFLQYGKTHLFICENSWFLHINISGLRE